MIVSTLSTYPGKKVVKDLGIVLLMMMQLDSTE